KPCRHGARAVRGRLERHGHAPRRCPQRRRQVARGRGWPADGVVVAAVGSPALARGRPAQDCRERALLNRAVTFARNLPGYATAFGWPGLLAFARARYGSSPEPVPIYLRGHSSPVWLRPGSTDLMTLREIFLARDYEESLPAATRARVVIDAGANIGLSAVFFAHRFPGARII